MKTVPPKKMVEHNALIQAIEAGVSQQELMQQFGFATLRALKIGYLQALVALGKVPAITSGRRRKDVDRVIGVNSRGSLVIPKQVVDALGLDKTAMFRVEKDGGGVCVTPTKRPPKTILRKKRP